MNKKDQQKEELEALQRTINDAQEQCKRIQEELNKPEKKWGFKIEEGYTSYSDGDISYTYSDNKPASNLGLLHLTKQEAEEFLITRKKVINIKHRIAELNEEWEAEAGGARYFFYKQDREGVTINYWVSASAVCASLEMRSYALANQIQDEFGDDLNALFEDY